MTTVHAQRLFDGRQWHRGARITADPDGTITEIAPGRAAPADLPMAVVLPGLVNAHVHLDLAPLQTAARGFPDWLRAVIVSRRRGPAPDATARANLDRAIRSGTTAFGDIDARGSGRRALIERGVTSRAYAEILGFDVRAEEAVRRVEAGLRPDRGAVAPGLSPHAPYSVSEDLVRAAVATGARLAVHVSETADEVRFVRRGDGPLRDLLQELGKWPGEHRAAGCSPLAWLHRIGCTGPGVLMIHMQVVEPGDLEILAAARSPVVVCPGTVDWFGRPAPAVGEMQRAGITVALGTDSVASNESLDMFREMALLRELCPELDPGSVLAMATRDGGRALGLSAGRLRLRGRLDAVCFEDAPSDGEAELCEWLTAGRPQPSITLVRGSPM